ncbi:Phytanoyl-CoA dioxygenase (PhyH) [Planctomycetes bacterium Poly30]|uniref:Phytanoyl-CoA dioxygenase (PhyH) n=1 Tax=Saltatorellus ferox TaxID=2528018 RepID=A0A518F0H4_9BACT|nr:Phytanoyl-CoA dioxygenase (PhyH) [Planctomycetes bacterium Poly30]
MLNLGVHHSRITELFPAPTSRADWERYVLPESAIAEFERQGFIQGVRLLSDAQVDALNGELRELMSPGCSGAEHFYEYHANESEDPDAVLFHALGAWRVRPGFHDLLWCPAFLMAAYQLLGAPVRLFHDQLFAKPPHHGGVVAWHQDYSYWTWTQPIAHLTAWIALDDVDESNGCLHYVPCSHRWGLLEKTGLTGDMDSVRSALDADQVRAFDQRVPVVMKRGHASFHHPLTMHGSYGNRSDRPRRATVINVLADGVLSSASETSFPGTTRYPKVPSGQPMGGEGYPLLLDPGASFAGWLDSIPRATR